MAQTDNTSISMMWSTQNSHTVRGKVNKYNYLNKRLGSFLKLNNAFPIPNHFPPTPVPNRNSFFWGPKDWP